ncbi:MAG: hypothetical protein JXQ30_06440 [Spirochaetes bacterium]|nr:hypothetical protein [Spirochaetota bacterium]
MEAKAEYLGKDTIDYYSGTGVAVQTAHIKPKGLCSTCASYPGCIFCINRNTPIQYCEEYTDTEPLSGSDVVERKTTVYAGDGIDISEEGRFKGLCVNCSKNRSCLYAKLKGGVWHCEEYC